MSRHLLNASASFAVLTTCLLSACDDPTRPAPIPSIQVEAEVVAAESPDRITATTQWNALTRQVISRREPVPQAAARVFALVSVAQYNAIIAAEKGKARGMHPSEAGAAAGAAAGVLGALYPVEQPVMASQLAADAAYFPTQPWERDADFAAGVAIGRSSAAAVMARAATDRSDAAFTGTLPTGVGVWTSAPAPARPLTPLWGQVRPWLMSSGSQFRPAPPPAFGSTEFLLALDEVRRVTEARTPAQLQIAQFWATGFGPGGPAGYFGAIASGLAAGRHLDERKAAHMLAVMHMAIMDASIGCYEAKYTYMVLRPVQADPLISTPVGRPNFPAYPSAHSCLSSAAGGVLAAMFPSETDTLDALVEEAGVSRIYAGLHYRFDVTAGYELGSSVALLALQRAPKEHEPIRLD